MPRSPAGAIRAHLGRVTFILRVLLRHRWGYLVRRLRLGRLVGYRGRAREEPVPTPRTLRLILEELGPTFIKAGQVLSTRPDLLPLDYIHELERLQDTAPPLPFETVREVVERELGKPLQQAFADFAAEPLAAASLAQVHRARLPTGRAVAVKVQRPDAEETVRIDLHILAAFASTLERVWEVARLVNLRQVVQEFSAALTAELDYVQEGRNAEQLRSILGDKDFAVPEIVWSHSSHRVLTMDLMQGTKINEVEALRARGLDTAQLAATLLTGTLRQVYVAGFFHADPHPGNVWVTPDGRIGLLDFGMVGRFDENLRESLLVMLIALADGDPSTYVDQVLELAQADHLDRRALVRDLGRMMSKYRHLPPRLIPMGEAIRESLDMLRRHRVRMPAEIAMMGKLFANLEGVCFMLDPDIDALSLAESVLAEAAQQRFHPSRMRAAAFHFVRHSRDLTMTGPALLIRVLRRAASGQIRVELGHGTLDRFPHFFEEGLNRLSLSLIAAALFVGSALLVLAQVGPQVFGFPLTALIGLAIGVIVSLSVGWSILRSFLSRRRERHPPC